MTFFIHEPYRRGSSPLHRLDPRLKVIGAVAFIVLTVALPAPAWGTLGLLALVASAVHGLARLPLRLLRARVASAMPFIALAALSVPFVRAGHILWAAHWGAISLQITREGLEALGAILAKGWLSLWMSALLVAVTPLPDLQRALDALGMPAILSSTIALMLRYLFVLGEEALRLQAAREARSVGRGRNVFWRARVVGGMVGSLWIRSLERAERIYAAMIARGYDGRPRSLHRLTWSKADTRAAILWGVALSMAAALRILL